MNELRQRILCVDDDPLNLRIYEAMLLPKGFDIIKAENGSEALEIIAKEQVDLVLLDVMMPGMNGFEVCRRLKDSPATAPIPVILISALNDSESRDRGLQAGSSLFLTKPIAHEDLTMNIRAVLGKT